MKSTDKAVSQVLKTIAQENKKEISIMEVCGTHTNAIHKYGINSLLPDSIKLISGPGCPVCVTSQAYIDTALKLCERDEVIIAAFGDMMRVRGSSTDLYSMKSLRSNIQIVYSPREILKIAESEKGKNVVFLAAGFETTAPIIALLAKEILKNNIKNIFFLSALKRMKPVLEKLLTEKTSCIDGIICPGHVAAICGSDYFCFIADIYGVPASICGFGALDIAAAVYVLQRQINGDSNAKLVNLYKRCVKKEGNEKANCLMSEVFGYGTAHWRGIGTIEESALVFKGEYLAVDAYHNFNLREEIPAVDTSCLCGDILMGNKSPEQCIYFAKKCTPNNPLGPCMVSSEGACAVYYAYRGV